MMTDTDWELRRKVQSIVGEAQRKGILRSVADVACERCGKQSDHKHHEDYAKPLEVTYLCRQCHGLRHRELGWGMGVGKGPTGKAMVLISVALHGQAVNQLKIMATELTAQTGLKHTLSGLVRLAVRQFLSSTNKQRNTK